MSGNLYLSTILVKKKKFIKILLVINMELKEKFVRLKNKYTNDIVFTKDIADVYRQGDMDFIRVYNEKNPERTYLANKEAFVILDK